jgi:hypothetical protein
MLASLCLLLTPCLFGDRVQLPSAWEEKQDWRLELIKGREDDVKKTRSRTDLILSVEARSETGYVFRFLYGKSAITEGLPEEPRARYFAERMSSISDGLMLDVLCSPKGSIQGLLQPEKITAHYEQMMIQMHQLFTEAKVPPKTIDALLKQTFETVTGPNMEALTLKEAQLFLRFAGMELELDKKVEFETELPNPLGGDPYPAKGWFSASAIPDQPAELLVECGSSIDAERARQLMLESLSELAEQTGKPAPKPEQLPKIEVEDRSTYFIDRRSGLPRLVENTRTSTTGSRTRIDRTSIRWLPPAAKPAETPR